MMPYHLLERTQQAKNILFHNADDLPHDTRNRLRRAVTQQQPSPFVTEIPASTRYQSIPRVSPPRRTHGGKHAPRASAGLSIVLCGIIIVTVFVICALYLLYARLQRRRAGPRRSSRLGKLITSPIESPTTSRDNRPRPGMDRAWHIRGLSFGGSRRRKAPPPSLDLEALKPARGSRKGGGFWASLPEAVQGMGSAGTLVSAARKSVGVDSGEGGSGSSSSGAWSSSSAYSAGAGARLIAQIVPEGVRSAVAGSAWGSGDSLADGMLGVGKGGDGLPVKEGVRADGELGLGLGKYFEEEGVGIKREVV